MKPFLKSICDRLCELAQSRLLQKPTAIRRTESFDLAKSGDLSCSGRRCRDARRGLAMLELVLAIPILIGITGVMINYGTFFSWRVRQLGMMRNAVWNNRYPRTGSSNPLPANWPAMTGTNAADAGNVPELDDSRVDQEVARGAYIGALRVDKDLLDPTRGLRAGSADLTRNFPVPASGYSFTVSGSTYLLDDKWQFYRMPVDAEAKYRLVSNMQQRMPVIYSVTHDPGLVAAFVASIRAVLQLMKTELSSGPYLPFTQPRVTSAPSLGILDKDQEHRAYGQGVPNLHPSLMEFPSATVDEAKLKAKECVDNLINRIQGDTKRNTGGLLQDLASRFYFLYTTAKTTYATSTDGAPPGELDELDRRIQLLDPYRH